MTTYPSEAVAQTERALLGSLLLDGSLWSGTDVLRAEDFSLDSHRQIFKRMAAMRGDGMPVDLPTLGLDLGERVDACGGPAYLGSLIEHAMPENFPAYVRQVSEAARERRYNYLRERLGDTIDREARLEILAQMQEHLQPQAGGEWRSLFHTREEVETAPPLSFAIDGFLQEQGVTLIGGLAGHGKTLCMLAMTRALLECGTLFTRSQATRAADRVLYLIPEAALGPFSARLRTFHLVDYIGDRLFIQTLSSRELLSLTDPRLLNAAEGADVFLDTAVRFMQGDENDASEQRAFAQSLFNLQRAGARTITGAHHSPKAFSKDTVMTLENVLRGSGDIGAMLCTAWGLKQIDPATNSIYIANVKPRDFQPCEPFIIQGRPSLDQTGYFEMTHPPGFAGSLGDHVTNVGRPAIADKGQKMEQARKMKAQGLSYREIGREIGVSVGTISGWLSRIDEPPGE